jgi:hypothetical protein
LDDEEIADCFVDGLPAVYDGLFRTSIDAIRENERDVGIEL